ncbi:MAG: FGGY-family carbohydrate kinase [Mogibacterium sp.]|nr:FGGY-family carbohydrate kinase [Mogibacterium sp.]
MAYILAYDIGTTGVKTCLFEVGKVIQLISASSRSYPLYILDNGGAEQDGDDWWNGMAECTREIFADSALSERVRPEDIAGISFCSQMQGLALVDKNGVPVHRPMSYMDQRAKEEIKKGIAYGVQIAGANVLKLIPSLRITGAVSSSVKDPVWKYKWIEVNEPENYARAYKWLDVKDYLICRCTGEFKMTEDSAFATLIYDVRPESRGWSEEMCEMFGINMDHLPEIIRSTDMAGKLTAKAASDLGLVEGIPVFGGGGDSSLIGVGAGAVRVGDTHIYSGTSGWVITVTDKQMVDVTAMIAAIVGAQEGRYNYFAEMETAGKCLEWVRDHMAKDEIGVYVSKEGIPAGYEERSTSLYSYMMECIKDVEPGSGGVIFTPWLHGNRCPFEDPNARGMFFGIGLDTGKTEMIHAVLEGVFYHIRWMLECEKRRVRIAEKVRFVGGGALSPVACQMLADITGKTIETVDSPQNVGSVGACAVTAVGLGLIPDLDCVRSFIPVVQTYRPDKAKHRAYNKYYKVFKQLYLSNKRMYKLLNDC